MSTVKYRLQNLTNNYLSVAAGFKMAFCSPCGWYTCTKTCWKCHFNTTFINTVHFIGVINSILMYQTYLHGKVRRTSESLYGSMHTAQQSPSPWISCKQGQKFLINLYVTRFHFERTLYAFLHTYIHIYIHKYIHTYTYIHTYIHACMHAYIHTYIHTHITHIYLYIYLFIYLLSIQSAIPMTLDTSSITQLHTYIYIKHNTVNNVNILQHKH